MILEFDFAFKKFLPITARGKTSEQLLATFNQMLACIVVTICALALYLTPNIALILLASVTVQHESTLALINVSLP